MWAVNCTDLCAVTTKILQQQHQCVEKVATEVAVGRVFSVWVSSFRVGRVPLRIKHQPGFSCPLLGLVVCGYAWYVPCTLWPHDWLERSS